jgi:hypothetical protein
MQTSAAPSGPGGGAEAANDMVPYVNAVLRDLLANIAPICGGSDPLHAELRVVPAILGQHEGPDHIANLGRLDRTLGTLLRTWKAMNCLPCQPLRSPVPEFSRWCPRGGRCGRCGAQPMRSASETMIPSGPRT